MKLAIPGWDVPTLAVAGSDERIAVRRVFCMGLNYHDHKKEMGITTDVPPFVFTKATPQAKMLTFGPASMESAPNR